MALIEKQGNSSKILTRESFDSQGNLQTKEDELALVTESASLAESWVSQKQWNLLWRDADILYQSPRPLSVYEGTYALEPNVTRFTVAKVVQSIVPQIHKGLFYEDPPLVLRPRPGTTQEIVNAKRALFSALLTECNFKREVKYALEQFVHLGTCILKWGVSRKTISVPTRKANKVQLPAGTTGTETITTDAAPLITEEERVVTRPTLEYRDIRDVLVDPKCELSDIREADWAIDKYYVDYYQARDLFLDPDYEWEQGFDADGEPIGLMDLWFPPAETADTPGESPAVTSTIVRSFVHHAESPLANTSGDPLRKKLEILEYWDRTRTIVTLNRAKVIKSVDNKFKALPFLSANYWNRPKAFYGMGVGLIVGQNQRVDQGIVNSLLKVLNFSVNPVYLRGRDSNQPNQMIRTHIGKILTVDDIEKGGYRLLDQPKVDPTLFAALQESNAATESSTGADQTLVQGTTAGPRTSMGRTAGGAATLAGASATRLEGPLGNFIDQVFVPFLYVLDELIFRYLPDHEIEDILGQELGKEYSVDLDQFHSAKLTFDVLAGASLAAKRTMAQSLVLIIQWLQSPQLQQQLAQINQEYLDFKPVIKLMLQASEWGDGLWNDIIKPLTPEMKQQMAQNNQGAKFQQQAAIENQKFQQKQALEDQAAVNREKRDIVRQSLKDAGLGLASTGEPSNKGFGSEEGVIE